MIKWNEKNRAVCGEYEFAITTDANGRVRYTIVWALTNQPTRSGWSDKIENAKIDCELFFIGATSE